MALVQPDGGSPIEPGRLDGTLFFDGPNAQLVARNVVKPVYPATVRQRSEANIITQAKKSWDSTLTEPQRQAWRDFAPSGVQGIGVFRETKSAFEQGGLVWTDVLVNAVVPELLTVLDAGMPAGGGFLPARVSSTALGGTYTKWFASPAWSSGRSGRFSNERMISTSAYSPGYVDLWPAVVARFPSWPGVPRSVYIRPQLLYPGGPSFRQGVGTVVQSGSSVDLLMWVFVPNTAALGAGGAAYLWAYSNSVSVGTALTIATSAGAGVGRATVAGLGATIANGSGAAGTWTGTRRGAGNELIKLSSGASILLAGSTPFTVT